MGDEFVEEDAARGRIDDPETADGRRTRVVDQGQRRILEEASRTGTTDRSERMSKRHLGHARLEEARESRPREDMLRLERPGIRGLRSQNHEKYRHEKSLASRTGDRHVHSSRDMYTR